jgi:hypothetical protein
LLRALTFWLPAAETERCDAATLTALDTTEFKLAFPEERLGVGPWFGQVFWHPTKNESWCRILDSNITHNTDKDTIKQAFQ